MRIVVGLDHKVKRLLEVASLPLLRRKAKKALGVFNPPFNLHLGCGCNKFEGWINVDAQSNGGAADMVWNLTKPLPMANATCRFIYSEHFLEHLSVDQGARLLSECRRLLIPGGVMRVAMPSLDDLIKKSYEGNWREQDWLTWPWYQHIKTRAEMLNVSFRDWGHQWLYDSEELHRRLEEAGFTNIKDVEWGASEWSELRSRETRLDSKLICEASF